MTRNLILPFLLSCFLSPAFAADSVLTVQLEDSGGKPVKDAAVTLATDRTRIEQVALDNGQLTFTTDLDQIKFLSLTTFGSDWSRMIYHWNPQSPADKPPQVVHILMEKAAPIGGTVVDQDGKPFPGAKITLILRKAFPNNPLQQVSLQTQYFTTDENGKWTCLDAPATFDSVSLSVIHTSALSSALGTTREVADLTALRAQSLSTKLIRGTPIDIQVRTPDGKPAAALILYGDSLYRVPSNLRNSLTTDDDGKLRLGILPNTSATITIISKEFPPVVKKFTVSEQPTPLVIDLPKPQTLAGRVLDKSGNPVGNAVIHFTTLQDAQTIDASITSDSDGTFHWDMSPPDELKADISASGFKAAPSVSLKLGQKNEITLTGATILHGTVVDAATGSPISDYQIIPGSSHLNGIRGYTPIQWQTPTLRVGGSESIKNPDDSFDASFTQYDKFAVRIAIDGYLPTDSPTLPVNGDRTSFTFKMEKADPLTGTLLATDANPLPNTAIFLVTANDSLTIRGGQLPPAQDLALRGIRSTKSDPQGHFTFPPLRDDYELLVLQDDGFARAQKSDFEKTKTLSLQKWARIEGEVVYEGKPVPRAPLNVRYAESSFGGFGINLAFDNFPADDNGHFNVPRVFPERLQIRHPNPEIRVDDFSRVLNPHAGETLRVNIGGDGRRVNGHISLPPELEAPGLTFTGRLILQAESRRTATPIEMMEMSQDQRLEFSKTPVGKALGLSENADLLYQQASSPQNPPTFDPAGNFRFPNIRPGKYLLEITATKPGPTTARGRGFAPTRQTTAIATTSIVIPDSPIGPAAPPLDAGNLTLQKAPTLLAKGDDASAFAFHLNDGTPTTLAAEKGHYTLLVFWMATSSAADFLPDRATLAPLWEAFGKTNQLKIITLALYTTPQDRATYLAARPMPWTHAYLDHATPADYPSTLMLPPIYGSESSTAWLISPEGKLLATKLRGPELTATVKSTLDK